MIEVTAKYDVPYKVLNDNIREVWERYEAHLEAPKLTSERERVIAFCVNFDWI